jgi:Na+/melibiose symporter-like transporter
MKRNLAYALVGLPLAFFALPLYVHLPKLYAEHVGLSLAAIGAVLLGARLLDAVLDPLIGRWCDRHRQRKQMLLLALPLLLGGWLMLFLPPPDAGLLWLVGGLLLAYAGYSLATINHNAWGAEFPADDSGRLQVTAWREGAALCGVMLAAGLPATLADDLALGLARLSWVFVPALLIATALALWLVPRGAHARTSQSNAESRAASLWRLPMFRKLVSIYTLNGVAAAVPATLVLFYVADVLQAGAWSGVFLLLYFLAGALALPFWVGLAGRIGRLAAWRNAMLLAMASFAMTPFLGSGDTALFAVVCIASGIALGADLAMPPALLAEHVAQHGQAATSYGWWAAVTKLSLALAAGIALPLVALLGYVPGNIDGGSLALAWVYGGLPLLLKATAYFSLLRAHTSLQALDQGVPA